MFQKRKPKKSNLALAGVVFGIFAVAIALYFLYLGLDPTFFDIFGFAVFSFLMVIGIRVMKGKPLAHWMGYVLFLIGVLGILVDGWLVISTYILG